MLYFSMIDKIAGNTYYKSMRRILVGLVVGLLVWNCLVPIYAKTNEETYQEKLDQLKPDDVNGYYQLGLWCKQNKLLEQAKTQFNRVLELDPKHKKARQDMDNIIQSEKDVKIAEIIKKYGPYKGVLDKAGADKENLLWEKAREKETEHFIVKTNLSNDALQDTCFLLERAYFAVQDFLDFPEPNEKNIVYVSKSRTELEKIHQELLGRAFPPNQGGLSIYKEVSAPVALKNDYLLIQYLPPTKLTDPHIQKVIQSKTTEVLIHEMTHYCCMLLGRQYRKSIPNITSMPIWLSEGLAEYFAPVNVDGNKLVTTLHELRVHELKLIIQNGSYIRLDDFIHLSEKELNSNDHYAIAWGLVHFLMNSNGQKYKNGLKTYINRWGQGRLRIYDSKSNGLVWVVNQEEHVKLFEECIGVPIDQLEKEWKKYILQLK